MTGIAMSDDCTPFAERTTWGPWSLCRTHLVLELHIDGRFRYDVEECVTSAEALDRICQVNGKGYGPDVAGHLVAALDDLLRPQARLCSFGASKRIRAREIPAIVAEEEIDTLAGRLVERRAAKAEAEAGLELRVVTFEEFVAPLDAAVREVRERLGLPPTGRGTQ